MSIVSPPFYCSIEKKKKGRKGRRLPADGNDGEQDDVSPPPIISYPFSGKEKRGRRRGGGGK